MSSKPRVLTAAVMIIALLFVGACSKSDDTTTTGTTAGTTAGTTPGTTTGTAAPGQKAAAASSEDLKKWQTALNAVGCSAGPVDGIEGGETEAAIRAFQAFSGLTVDGLLGPQTEAKLTADVKAGVKVCTGTTPTTKAPGTSTTTAKPASTTTTAANAPCPPNCAPNLGISPGFGPAGTTVEIVSAGTNCAGMVTWNGSPTNVGTLEPQGMNKLGVSFTIPAGTKAGTYVFTAITCKATAYFVVN